MRPSFPEIGGQHVDPNWGLRLAISGFFAWAAAGTGLATDDFVHLNNSLRTPLAQMLLPSAYLSAPLLHYTHALAYSAFGMHLWAYDLLKAAYLLFAFAAAGRFFALFVSVQRAWLAAIIFILCPLHDGATLWLTGQYLILSLAFYLFAYIAAHHGQIGKAALLAALASFSSYGSPPLAAGLTLMLLWQRNWRGALALAAPNALYVLYYSVTSVMLKAGTSRLPSQFEFLKLLKSYLMQVASFADAALGPSAWAKYALSLGSLTAASAAVAVLGVALLWRWTHGGAPPSNRQTGVAITGSLTIMLSAFGVFALTAAYPQVAFNLGGRVLIYGSLFLAVLLMRFASQRLLTVLATVTIFSFMGITDHWRDWNRTTQASITQLRAQFRTQPAQLPDQFLFVSGLQYSRLGPMTHIDHLTASYVIRETLTLADPARQWPQAVSFNRRLQLQGDVLVDIKYNERFAIGSSILLYDAERDTLARVARADIAARLAALQQETRHWTQLLGPGLTRDAILWLMPSVKYAYP